MVCSVTSTVEARGRAIVVDSLVACRSERGDVQCGPCSLVWMMGVMVVPPLREEKRQFGEWHLVLGIHTKKMKDASLESEKNV